MSKLDMLIIKEDDLLTMEEAWGHSLIGFVVGAQPGTKLIDALIKVWPVACSYSIHKNGCVVFKFATLEDKLSVLEKGSYSSLGWSWIIKEIPPYFSFADSCFSCVPIWVNLHNLSKRCWSKKVLSMIGSQIGKPIFTDMITGDKSLHDSARILVEVDLTVPPMEKVCLQMPNGLIWEQPVEYEIKPVVCSKCKTLGHKEEECQGGLARGMSYRGHSASPGMHLTDLSSTGDSRRVGPGLNGYNSLSERTVHSSREDPMQRYMPDRYAGPSGYDQSNTQERNIPYGNRDSRSTDRGFDRSLPVSPPSQSGGAFTQNVTSEKVWPEDRLRDMSMSAIKEFYSAKDENEVALCIKDLNNPSFFPSMISLWVTDSFERKDMERDLLAKLLITLTKYRDGIISQAQLIKGFDSVLMSLEDAVNDAPKAAEFLGRIFARVIMESVIPLNEIERLIYEGGEEQGRLVEIGLAAEVLGTTLELIVSERGDSVLNEIRSNLRLEKFRPPGSNKPWRLDKFI